MTVQQWYADNMLIEGQKVYETVSGFWVFVRPNGDDTFRIATNDVEVRWYVRSHKLETLPTFEIAEEALEKLTHTFVLTEVKPEV